MPALPKLISMSTSGVNANGPAFAYSAAGNGRYVVFASDSTNLTPQDGVGQNIFLRDTATGRTFNVDVSSNGAIADYSAWRGSALQNPDNPTEVAFTTNGFGEGFNLYIRDVNLGTTRVIAKDISTVDYPFSQDVKWHLSQFGYSNDGSHIAYASANSTTVANDTNRVTDIFVEELATGDVERISVAADGTEANGSSYNPIFSPDGTKVAFWSNANNLSPTDTNFSSDVYIKDLNTGDVTLVSKALNGGAANGASVSVGGFSSDGRYLLFESAASNLVANDRNNDIDVFAYDMLTGDTIRVSERSDGVESNGDDLFARFIPGTHIVEFTTSSNNLLADDVNMRPDVVYTRLGSGEFETLDFTGPVHPNKGITGISYSADGNYAYLVTNSANLVPKDKDTVESIVRVPMSQILKTLQHEGTFRADSLWGDDKSNYMIGKNGNDQIHGGAGDDYIQGDSGNDTLVGERGADYLLGGTGSDELFGRQGNDYLDGGLGEDKMHGNLGNDTYVVNDTQDKVFEYVGQGTDLIISSASYILRDNSQHVENLTLTGLAFMGVGNMQNNVIKGTMAQNMLNGLYGHDTLLGFAGNDSLLGGYGNDRLYGHNGNDYLNGDVGWDKLFGGNGDDTLVGGNGNDFARGGNGDDTLLGGDGDDIIHGDNGHDTLRGNFGDDKLYAGVGADRIVGGLGSDVMFAGNDSGKDTFVFITAEDSPSGPDHDVIFLFDSGEDVIDLAQIDANENLDGNRSFNFAGMQAEANSIWYETNNGDATLYADTDGDAVADFEVELRDVTHLSFGDFIL